MKQVQEQKITKDTLIADISRKYPEAVDTLLSYGVHCVGCHVSEIETLEQGLKGHGLSDEVVAEAVEKLNEAILDEKDLNKESGPITIGQKAVAKIKQLIKEHDGVKGLQIKVIPGGCSGYSYELHLVKTVEKDDMTITKDGAHIFIPKETLDLIKGAHVEYNDGLQDAGFKITNPNAESTCGCGSSFS